MMNIRLRFSHQDLKEILKTTPTDYPDFIPFNQNYVNLVRNASEYDLAKWRNFLQPPRMVVMFICDVYWNPFLQGVSVSWHGQELHDMFEVGKTHLIPLRGSSGTFPGDFRYMVEMKDGYDSVEAHHLNFLGYVTAEAA